MWLVVLQIAYKLLEFFGANTQDKQKVIEIEKTILKIENLDQKKEELRKQYESEKITYETLMTKISEMQSQKEKIHASALEEAKKLSNDELVRRLTEYAQSSSTE